jgi:PelA/Pel-15E family pectate lyase
MAPQPASITWRECLNQPQQWYASDEALRIADNLLLYQRDTGGWPKNIDMAAQLTEAQKAKVARQKKELDSTIDNWTTSTQIEFLAKVYTARQLARHKEAALKGVDYLLEAQYENGGWPQYYPKREGYYEHITYNDDAMIGVMRLLGDVGTNKPDYAFVDEDRRRKARSAIQKGIECILKTQVIVDGRRTVWCAQHDRVTFAPAPARTFEKVSLSGQESVGVVRFLMGIDHPDERVIEAIQSAVAWFDKVKLSGIRWVEQRNGENGRVVDRVVVKDPAAGPLWARFYEIGTNRPIFAGRDGVVKYDVAEIEQERRSGYQWYTDAPARLLAEDYPAWQKKWARGKNVLSSSAQPVVYQEARRSMGTTFEIIAYGEDRARLAEAANAAFEEIDRLDRQMSNYSETSELTDINRNAARGDVIVEKELFDLLVLSLDYSRASGGAFDITVGPLARTWGFFKGQGRLPEPDELKSVLEKIGYERVTLNEQARTIRFDREGIELDLGGIGKGYAVDKAVEILRQSGVRSALITSGTSSITAVGAPPNQSAWTIGVRDPLDPSRTITSIKLRDGSLATSGCYEKTFQAGGKTYCHIMDPRTGFPIEGVMSATVIAKRAVDADALSTTLMVMGVERARECLRSRTDVRAILFYPHPEGRLEMMRLNF